MNLFTLTFVKFSRNLVPSRSVQKQTYWSKRSRVSALLEQSVLGRRSVGAGVRGKRGNFWSKRSTGASQHWQLASQVMATNWGNKLGQYWGQGCKERWPQEHRQISGLGQDLYWGLANAELSHILKYMLNTLTTWLADQKFQYLVLVLLLSRSNRPMMILM